MVFGLSMMVTDQKPEDTTEFQALFYMLLVKSKIKENGGKELMNHLLV